MENGIPIELINNVTRTLKDDLSAEVKGEKAYLYKAVLAYVGNVEYKESLVFESEFDSDEILEAVAVYSSQNDIIISNNYSPVVREISRKVHDNNGECIGEELVEYTVSFVETNNNAELFSFNAVESEVCLIRCAMCARARLSLFLRCTSCSTRRLRTERICRRSLSCWSRLSLLLSKSKMKATLTASSAEVR